MLWCLEQDFFGFKMVVVFDVKGKIFWYDMYEEYKVNWLFMLDDFVSQIVLIYEIVKVMGLFLLIVFGVEVDDVIGILVYEVISKGIDVVVFIGDKDMVQLVSDYVMLINIMIEICMDWDGVKEKFGVSLEQIIDYLVLVGDKVDNIFGVNKCGFKIVVKWLQSYQDLDNLMEYVDEIKGKIGEYLCDVIEILFLSWEFVIIKIDVELEFGLEDFKYCEQDDSQLLELFKEYEFCIWVNELESSDDQVIGNDDCLVKFWEVVEKCYSIVIKQSELDDWLVCLCKVELFVFDIEIISLCYSEVEVVGVLFVIEFGEVVYVFLVYDYMGVLDQLDWEVVLE